MTVTQRSTGQLEHQHALLSGARGTAGTILLVDDDVGLRNAYQLYFETNGFIVFSAGSIVHALRLIQTERIDVLVLDVFLDQEDGLELLKGIVAAQVHLPVLVMSGVSANHNVFQMALQAGAAGVFTKWLPLDALLSEVLRVIPKSTS